MYLVYLLPLLLIVIVALAIFTGPILAVIVFALFLVGLGLYKFFGPGTDPEHERVDQGPATGSPVTSRREEVESDTGIWGEEWPEQRQDQRQEPSQ
jgi:hypothetical protein